MLSVRTSIRMQSFVHIVPVAFGADDFSNQNRINDLHAPDIVCA